MDSGRSSKELDTRSPKILKENEQIGCKSQSVIAKTHLLHLALCIKVTNIESIHIFDLSRALKQVLRGFSRALITPISFMGLLLKRGVVN